MASGRAGTGDWRYRRNRDAMLAESDLCALCGHPGARSADHIVTATQWRALHGELTPEFNDPANLQPAHGTMGNRQTGTLNPCPTCGLLCNQHRKDKALVTIRSEDW